MGEQKTEMCPCIDAHRRLMDLHEDIHRVVNNYLDANEFRRFLNSAIQNSRGVSFLVQKRKAKWADFGEWYGAWQAVAKQNPVMGWGVASRNRIVKEEDLLTLSQAVLSLFDERLQVAEDVVTVPPSTSVDEMVAVFADFIAKQPSQKQRWIRVQRRWVDDQLPQYELVSALRELYAGVSELVRLTHEVSDVTSCNAPPFARSCVDATFDPELACLGPGDPLPSAVIDARTGRATQMEYGIIKADAAMMKLGETRYGLIPRRGQTAVEYAAGQMDLFKRFLEVDGSAGGVLLLFRGREEMRISPVMFPKTTPRELVVASTVEIQGAWQFDGGLFAGEMWLTPPNHGGARGSLMGVTADDLLPPDEDLYDPDPLGGREEALIVQAVQSDGSSRVLVQPFARTRRGIVYGPLMDDDTGTWLTPFLRPIWRRWPKWNGWTPGPRG